MLTIIGCLWTKSMTTQKIFVSWNGRFFVFESSQVFKINSKWLNHWIYLRQRRRHFLMINEHFCCLLKKSNFISSNNIADSSLLLQISNRGVSYLRVLLEVVFNLLPWLKKKLILSDKMKFESILTFWFQFCLLYAIQIHTEYWRRKFYILTF